MSSSCGLLWLALVGTCQRNMHVFVNFRQKACTRTLTGTSPAGSWALAGEETCSGTALAGLCLASLDGSQNTLMAPIKQGAAGLEPA
jgi:hypothetical protein